MTDIHFLNINQGNMVVVILPGNKVVVYDCNITNNNIASVFQYLKGIMPKGTIDIFINSHRDTDHMRGVKILHNWYPIGTIWDSGVSGTITGSDYVDYMTLKRSIPNYEVKPGQYWENIQILNGKRENVSDINSQSIVIKISEGVHSAILAGDSDAPAWRNHIVPNTHSSLLKSSILFASHHGAISFFDDPADSYNYYTDHIQAIAPQMTIISVGENGYGHPHDHAISLYNKYSSGSNQGNKVLRTDYHGNMLLRLETTNWNLWKNR